MGFMAHIPLKRPRAPALEPGDIFALITDGIYEYENRSGEAFGEDGVAELIRDHATDPMARLIETIVQAVEEFSGGAPQNDDMTLLLLRRLPE